MPTESPMNHLSISSFPLWKSGVLIRLDHLWQDGMKMMWYGEYHCICKMLEFSTGKCCPIFGYQYLWQTQRSEHTPHLLTCVKWGCWVGDVDVYPLRANMDQDQKHSTQEGPRIVNMDSWPWLLRPFPWVQRDMLRIIASDLADGAGFHCLLDLSINTRSPHMLSGKTLHSSDTGSSCSSAMTLSQALGGTMILLPHSKKPSYKLSSSLLLQ